MDVNLINKLPHGGEQWDVKNKLDIFTQGTVITPKIGIINVVKTETRVKKISLLEFIAKQVDELYDIYNQSTKNELENTLRDTLIQFVTSKNCHKWLGPKKARLIVSFLMKNWCTNKKDEEKLYKESEKIILDFLAWFLDNESIKEMHIERATCTIA